MAAADHACRSRPASPIAVAGVQRRLRRIAIDGDPTHDISAVRNTDAVVCRGVVYDPAELFAAVGMSPH
jgi:hypothetical protein